AGGGGGGGARPGPRVSRRHLRPAAGDHPGRGGGDPDAAASLTGAVRPPVTAAAFFFLRPAGSGGTPACFSQAICSANRCGETVLLFSWSAKWWYIRTTRPGSSAGPEAAGPAVATAGSAGTAGPAATSTAAHTTAGNRRRRMSDSKPPGSL